jgi:DNA-binding protein H-NS
VIDLSPLSYSDLVELRKNLEVEIVRRKESEKQNLIAELQNLVASKGFSLSDVLGTSSDKKAAKKAASTAKAQFRNPADAEQTWTGRGRKPQWAIEFLAQGGSLEALRIA